MGLSVSASRFELRFQLHFFGVTFSPLVFSVGSNAVSAYGDSCDGRGSAVGKPKLGKMHMHGSGPGYAIWRSYNAYIQGTQRAVWCTGRVLDEVCTRFLLCWHQHMRDSQDSKPKCLLGHWPRPVENGLLSANPPRHCTRKAHVCTTLIKQALRWYYQR